MKTRTPKIRLVTKRSAWKAACGQDAPQRETKDREKVTCGACMHSRVYRERGQ